MRQDGVRLVREELYDLVWAKPLRRLADELGVMVAELVVACEELDIPRPPSGHWSKVAHGQCPERPALPQHVEGVPHEVVLAKAPDPGAAPTVPTVTVRKTLERPLPAVAALRQKLTEHHPDRDGIFVLRGDEHGTTFRVSGETRDRALRVLDALGRTLVARGHEFRFEAPKNSYRGYKLEAIVADEAVSVTIAEHMIQRAIEPKERDRSWGRKFDLAPSGKLILGLHAGYSAVPRTPWTDKENRPIEAMLGHVVLAIEAAPSALAEERREAEARQRAEETERARQAREEQRARHQKALGEDLLAMATKWSQAQTVRAFVRAVEEAAPASELDPGFTAWLAWAKGFAASLDPLTSPDEIAREIEPRTSGGNPWKRS